MISRDESKAALFIQARRPEVQGDSISSCLVALCTSRFITALLNEGYDIPPPHNWQDSDFLCRKPSFTVKEGLVPNKPNLWGQENNFTTCIKIEKGKSVYFALVINHVMIRVLIQYYKMFGAEQLP